MRSLFTLAVVMAAGCCSLDHDQLARQAAERAELLDGIAAVETAQKTPEAFTRLALLEADGWRLVAARASGEPLPDGLRERVEASAPELVR